MGKIKLLLRKINNSSDLKELSINSFWSLLASVISKGLIFVAWLMVAKILGKEGNGQVGVIRSTINLFMIFAGSGIALTTTKYIPELITKDKDKVSRIITWSAVFSCFIGLILSFLLFFGAPYISKNILNSAELADTLKISSFLLFLSVVDSLISGCLKGFKDFKGLLLIGFLYGICLFASLYIGTIRYGVEGTFAGFTFSTFILVLLGGTFLKRNMIKYGLKFAFKLEDEVKILKKFTLPAILTGVMVIPFKWGVDTIMVNQPSGYKELGLYAAIILFQNMILMITATLDAPLITIMVKEKKDKRIEKLNLIIPWAIGTCMVLPILFFPSIFNVFLGEEYTGDDNYRKTLFLIMLTTTIILYKQGIARIMIVNSLMWFSFFSNLVWGTLLVLFFYFVKNKNAETLAYSYFIAYVINTILIIPIYIKKKIIPLTLITSRWAILIWIIFSGTFIVFYNYSFENVIFRIFALVILFITFVGLFYNLLLKD
ncbi:Membrane protein involved in the export of O-antigen and teichoic acid [Sinomicrobium oceani]|uniref:Membrane protein involved in the export of O-antigen and teichoic acid n=1 Tax=Sinomicrobium oceani TaxID=1150368 RepID=A0A1K1QVS6_9FLAO|nr:oligosaccharide flippase family protein [Sinomicrobium oceani]SFW64015.1 Membrane protein involved in the export of O-antigen and teichoic acid [Sinomicrobium oceani]